jgi:hypothetical protein
MAGVAWCLPAYQYGRAIRASCPILISYVPIGSAYATGMYQFAQPRNWLPAFQIDVPNWATLTDVRAPYQVHTPIDRNSTPRQAERLRHVRRSRVSSSRILCGSSGGVQLRQSGERLNISQPVSQLTDQAGGERPPGNLFIRSQTGPPSLVQGRQFLVFARQMLHMRDDAVRATSSDQTGTEWPLRFGYSPFADHKLVDEALTGYRNLCREDISNRPANAPRSLRRWLPMDDSMRPL